MISTDMLLPHVMIVSKPVAPPWFDSNKNLVRDIVLNADSYIFHVMSIPGFDLGKPNVIFEPVYRGGGAYSPTLLENLRAFSHLIYCDRAISLYHFFFTPNPRTSLILKTIMSLKKKKSLHTLSSCPENLDCIQIMLFSDLIIALSDMTEKRLRAKGIDNVVKIYPGVEIGGRMSSDYYRNRVSKTLALAGEFLILYSGDYEFSGGHEMILDALPEVVKQIPGVKVVMACRPKTGRSILIQKELVSRVERMGFSANVYFLGEVNNMKELIGASDVVVFPAQSHAHKMDIPLFLLESLEKGKPIIISNREPFNEVMKDEAGFLLPPGESRMLANYIIRLFQEKEMRERMGEKGRKIAEEHFDIKKISKEYMKCYRALLEEGSSMKKYYDVYSNIYDLRRDNAYHRLIDRMECTLVETYLEGAHEILEAGCGTGLIMDRLKGLAWRHTGIDMSFGMLASAVKKGHNVIQCDLLRMPFKDDSFNGVYSLKVLPHVEDVQKAIGELVRVTCPGGKIILEFYNLLSLRGLRWALKRGVLAGKIAEKLKETDIYTRYDTIWKIFSYIPPDLEVLHYSGIMVFTPFAAILEVPVISGILSEIEKRSSNIFSHFGGFIVIVLRKKQ